MEMLAECDSLCLQISKVADLASLPATNFSARDCQLLLLLGCGCCNLRTSLHSADIQQLEIRILSVRTRLAFVEGQHKSCPAAACQRITLLHHNTMYWK